MRRRQFIAGLGSAAALPVVARAQQPARMRRIGVLMNAPATDADGRENRSCPPSPRAGPTRRRNYYITSSSQVLRSSYT